MMRIRVPFASAFFLLLLLTGYLGLTSTQIPQINDKALHFITFFVLTITFYWILDTTRRRTLNLTLLIITFSLGLGSEILQRLLPNDRKFDPLDIAANIVGSLSALGLCTLYHKRMLDRRRAKKGYGILPQGGEEADLELGETDISRQENGIVDEGEEVWDEMGGEESADGDGDGGFTPSTTSAPDEAGDAKK